MLVNNAAMFRHDRLACLEEAMLDAHIALNLRAPLLLTRELVRRLPEDAPGLVVNILDQRVVAPTGRYLSL